MKGLVGRSGRRFVVVAALLSSALVQTAAWSANSSDDGLWSVVPEGGVQRTAEPRQIVPQRYQTVSLNRVALDKLMAGVPSELVTRVADSNSMIDLPLADGSFGRFRLVESSILPPVLAKRYPEIRTWVAQGIDDPSATARLDLTPKGFHAQIISWQGTSYVDPYQPGDTQNYIAYRKNDYDSGKQMHCEVDGSSVSPKEVADPAKQGVEAKLASGENLRTYRLAMAATGEYTVFHGGSVLDGLSGIVTTVNRVNGIYEREVSVRFELVDNEDDIIFTNAATDPYSNTSNDLSANISTINSIIGNANYDVGHLVGTGGGGVAGLGVICTGSKARGLTGSGTPIGDAFDVDYVAHEMGHQFGGNHTFNGSGGNCNGSNRNGSTAYEPGSGITIQAYAGICGADNLQPNSEDYFHRVSLNEIIAHTTSGSGGTCGVLTATGNTPPTVTTDAAFTIPANTPFELTAEGDDADGDTLTYLWEQFNLGAANSAGVLTDDGSRPLFRSFTPTLSSSRMFPSLRYILAGQNNVPNTAPLPGTASPDYFTGERLPTTNRTMNFRVTARDNRAGGGGTNEASTAITVVSTAGPFRVTAPNTAVSWAAGSSQSVTWDVAGTSGGSINTANVRIRLSLDGGQTWPIELAASEANDGAATVTIPVGTPATDQARLRIDGVGNVFFDISDADFSITGSNAAPTITANGSLSTRQGAPAVSGVVATVSDAEDAPGDLLIDVSGAPPELDVSVSNSGGNITLEAQAACTLVAPTSGNKRYPVQLAVTDLDGAVATASVNIEVARNRDPDIGSYADRLLGLSDSLNNSPDSLPGDADGNFAEVLVTPQTLPGGGTVSAAPDGTVSISTTGSTTLGNHTIRVYATDSCGASTVREFDLDVSSSDPVVSLESTLVTTDNGVIEPNECNQIDLTLHNAGANAATGVSATVSTSTPGVSITQPTVSFNDIAGGTSQTGLTPVEVSTDAGLACLSDIDFDVDVTWSGGGSPLAASFTLQVGEAASDNYVFTQSGSASLAGTATLVAGSQGDDVVTALTVPAGFDFELYGNPIAAGSTLQVSSNGNLQIAASGGSREYANTSLPDPGGADYGEPFPPSAPTLFPWYRDLRTDGSGGGIYTRLVGTEPNREWIVEWRAVPYSSSPGAFSLNFAIVFHEDSENFEYRYIELGTDSGPFGSDVTVGVQAASSGALFTEYSVNAAAVNEGDVLSASRPTGACNTGAGGCGPVNSVVIVESDGDTEVTEGGATDSYDVSLSLAPSGTVTVSLMAGPGLQVSPNSLDFTTISWSSPQTVTVTAIDDQTVEGDHAGSIAHSVSGGGYDGVLVADVGVAISDNDSAEYAFVAASSSADEGDGSASLSVAVTFNTSGTGSQALAAPISIPYSVNAGASTATGGGVDYSLGGGNVVIGSDGMAENIAVTLVDDMDVESDETITIDLGTETGGGAAQEAVVVPGAVASHTLTIVDNDNPSVIVTESDGSTTAVEGGAGDSYSIVLGSEPSGTVSITVMTDGQVQVSPTLLSFNAGNWSEPKTITVTAVDDAVSEGPHDGVISHSASGGGFNGVSIANVIVAITDNDDTDADLAISNVASPVFALAGETVNFEVTVNNLSAINDAPSADVAVTIVPALDNPQWTCTPDAGANCPAGGAGLPAHSVSLDRDSGAMYSISGDVPVGATPGTVYTATASVAISAPQQDPNAANDSAEATVTVAPVVIFADGFESP